MEHNVNEDMVTQEEHPQLFGHPKGLFYLFFAELWERFSFYGMRALLMLYMTSELFAHLGKEDADIKGIGIYAAYGALVYATPLLGGMIADRLLGYRKSITLGGILMALGHFAMAFPGDVFFFGALGLLIVGNGFFKPNISSFVGSLYEQGDERRDSGFTIFYMGINIGAFLSPLLCGWLGRAYGWHYGFGLAGIGMVAGLLFFWQGIRSNVFGNEGLQPKEYRDSNIDKLIYAGSLLLVPIASLLVYYNDLSFLGTELMGAIVGIVFLVALLITISIMAKVSNVEKGRIIVILFITLLLTVFWAFFEQAGSSITLFAERNVNLFVMNAAQTNSINALFIILLAIPFSAMWTLLGRRNPRTPLKYALGIAQLGLGFLLFAFSANFMDASGNVPFLFLILGYLFITTGELFVSPIGLSKVTELAPKQAVAFFMGVFFLSSMGAHYIAGIIAKVTSTGGGEQSPFWSNIIESVTGLGNTAGLSDGVQSLANYTGVFTQIAVVSFACAIITLLLSPIINRLMKGIH